MFKFQCHGSYLRDFDVRGDVLRVGDITDDQADAMLTASPYLYATKPWDERHGLMLNKGFAIVHRDEGDDSRCLIVANHDGRYSLHSGAWAFFAEKYGLEDGK